MENIKENLQILINQKKEIKDSTYIVNLDESGVYNGFTEKINGTLKSIFVEIGEMQNLYILVYLKDYPYVKILDSQIKNNKSFFPVCHETGPEGGDWDPPSRRQYSLNDELGISIEGIPNGKVKVVVRYE